MALTRDKVFWDAFINHTERTTAATKKLAAMLDDLPSAPALAKEIKTLEHQGDRITHDCVQALHQTWITPLDRDDIHTLISRLDDVLDYVDAASDRIALYELDKAPEEAVELAKMLVQVAIEMQTVVKGLVNIKDAAPLLDLCKSINMHEHDADGFYRRGIAKLFKEEKDPVLIMKWRDIYESLEKATDRAEDVANVIEGIVLEHA